MLENFSLDHLTSTFDSFIETAKKHAVYAGAAGIALLALAGGGYWYYATAVQKEQAAYTILTDCLSQYEQATQGKAQWADVATMAHAGYEKFSSTKVAPYILAVEVDALLVQENKQEALAKLDCMLATMSASAPLYPLYQLKQALIKLDLPDLKEAAVLALQKLADAKNNDFADAAQYYLGLYYQNAGDAQKAIQVWKSLAAINDTITDTMARSPWATLAESKMSGLA